MSSRSPDGHFQHLKSCAKTLLLLLALPAGLALALPDDRDQPIHIAADKALRDEKQGFTVYSGNVQMSQGSMELEADKLTIYHREEEADKIVAEGNPAKMRQQPELDKGLVHAHAGVIEYFKSEERVHLQTDARIEQDGALVTGDSIDYFIAEQLVKADSDQANQVIVVIPPSVQQETAKPPAGESLDPEVPAPNDQTEADMTAESEQLQMDAPPASTPQEMAVPAQDEPAEEDASGATDSE